MEIIHIAAVYTTFFKNTCDENTLLNRKVHLYCYIYILYHLYYKLFVISFYIVLLSYQTKLYEMIVDHLDLTYDLIFKLLESIPSGTADSTISCESDFEDVNNTYVEMI